MTILWITDGDVLIFGYAKSGNGAYKSSPMVVALDRIEGFNDLSLGSQSLDQAK